MANENALMAELAENLWKNFISEKNHEADSDKVSFYRAAVTANPGNNTLTIQRPYDNAVTVPCIPDMSDASVGDQVLVLRFGNGKNNSNHLVVAKGSGEPMHSWQMNTVSQDGYVPAPTSSNPMSVYATNTSGTPQWDSGHDILARIFGVTDITGASFSKNFRLISLTNQYADAHRRSYFYFNQDTKSDFTGIPTVLNAITEGSVLGVREVYWRSNIHVLVKVTEMYPVSGREHYSFYNNGTWTSWYCTYTTATSIGQAKANLGIGNATQNFYVSNYTGSDQLWGMNAVVTNENNTTYYGKRTSLVLENNGLLVYSSIDGTTIWNFTRPSTASNATIGTDNTSVSSGTKTEIGTLTLSSSRSYIVTFTLTWSQNSSGYRFVTVTYGDSATEALASTLNCVASSSSVTRQQVTIYLNGSTTNNVLHVKVLQNSGSALTVSCRASYARIN